MLEFFQYYMAHVAICAGFTVLLIGGILAAGCLADVCMSAYDYFFKDRP